MSQTKVAQEMMKIVPDMQQILSILRQANVSGPVREYAEKRIVGGDVDPALASAAHAEAKKNVADARAAGLKDTVLGVSVGILEALLSDIASYAKLAASRAEIKKLASKFEKALSK